MSILDSITDLQTDEATGYTITRRAQGTWADGVYTRGAVVALVPIVASVQPATGLQRVVGGTDMRQDAAGYTVVDVRQMFTETKLFAQHDQDGYDPAYEPDEMTYRGRPYLVFRVEEWELSGDVYYRATMTCLLKGAA